MTGLTVSSRGLGMSYGSTTALAGVDLDLDADRIHGLLGRNGAGKTTLLSLLAALRAPGAGSVRVDGRDPYEDEALMERVCLVRESGDLLADERIRTNLRFLEMARPTFDRGYAEQLLERFGLGPKQKVQALSRGQRSALGVIVGLASRAPLTMFDEVHLGMDAPSRQQFYDELLRDFAEHPRTVILSSHLISEVEPLLETVTILDRGRVLMSGEADEVRDRGATLTGPAALVDELTADRPVVGVRNLGPTRQVVLFGDLDEPLLAEAEQRGIQVGPVPLQDLFIHLTDGAENAAGPNDTGRHPS